jgi:hypothetical protein
MTILKVNLSIPNKLTKLIILSVLHNRQIFRVKENKVIWNRIFFDTGQYFVEPKFFSTFEFCNYDHIC